MEGILERKTLCAFCSIHMVVHLCPCRTLEDLLCILGCQAKCRHQCPQVRILLVINIKKKMPHAPNTLLKRTVTVFLKLCSQKTVCFLEQVMSVDKYLSILTQMINFVCHCHVSINNYTCRPCGQNNKCFSHGLKCSACKKKPKRRLNLSQS